MNFICSTLICWVFSSNIMDVKKNSKDTSCHLATFKDVDTTISNFWQVENNYHDSTNAFSPEERACESLFQNSTQWNSEGRFVVKLPVRDEVISQLGESKDIAERRFFALEKRLLKQPEVYDEYRKFLREYHELDHMYQFEETTDFDNRVHYYLPHYTVLKDTSTTTKLRVVFDVSCKTHSGNSLNNVLLVGPTVQQDLFSVLSQFRTFCFAMTADIAKMYRQVLINPSQRCLQRIFWRDTPQQELKIFELATVTYGTAPASFLAIRSLRELAQIESNLYPLASEVVLRDFYVNDMLTGAFTLNEALDLKNQTIALLRKGDFELRKWFSNSPLLRDDNFAYNKEIGLGYKYNLTRALGVFWNCELQICKH